MTNFNLELKKRVRRGGGGGGGGGPKRICRFKGGWFGKNYQK